MAHDTRHIWPRQIILHVRANRIRAGQRFLCIVPCTERETRSQVKPCHAIAVRLLAKWPFDGGGDARFAMRQNCHRPVVARAGHTEIKLVRIV